MYIAVTGSSGTLGRATVERLRADGHDVIGFDLTGTAGPGFTRVDLSDYGQTLDAFLGVTARHTGLDAVVHLAAVPVNGLVPDVTTFENNLSASYHVLFAAHRAGIRKVVLASSITAMGFPFEIAPPALPVDETYTRAFNTYGLGKVAEEAIAAQLVGWDPDASITALRFTNVVAPDAYDTFARAADPDYRRDLVGSWVDARDGAEAVALALAGAQPGFEVYNVAAPGSGNAAPSRAVAERWFPGIPVAEDLGEFESLMSTRKIQDRLGFRARYDWR
ncbi:NAD(P)-dependent oxidoreductase [Microbacterium aoyamense]|uniref:NAD(P)-dependent oxidoreductase n=1 Tax=Microbacterium aoyamense TaxID=344166 RepID=A0ABN2PLX7_9MICO|nr:NAD(P)-dependent oxidoreductase [Microbacterium aoyamense]